MSRFSKFAQPPKAIKLILEDIMERRKHKLTTHFCKAKRCIYFIQRGVYELAMLAIFRNQSRWSFQKCKQSCYHKV